jgi:ABC-type polysaccharide/polyol phosphate export permease
VLEYIRELFRYRELLFIIAWRDIKIKYKQSVMGFMWAIFMPLLIISAGILVKYAMAVLSGKPMMFSDVATVSVKALPWSFFVGSVRFATNSLLGNTNLVAKIYFPKEIFPIAAVLSNLFDFVIAGCFLGIILSVARIGYSYYLLWLSVLVIMLIILLIGFGMLLSALSLFYRDVKYIVEVFLTFGIFFTPVFYEVEMFGKWSYILLLNPIAPILEAIMACVVYHRPPEYVWLMYSASVTLFIFLIGYPVFKKLEPSFAESI